MKTRYTVTKVDKSGLRVIAGANQGRCHFDTRAAAEKWLSAALQNNSSDTLKSVWGDLDKVKVMPVECYDHGDATRTVFGFDGEQP